MRILLLTPPMTQVNTPYPATAYLTGFLKSRNFNVTQKDPGIELLLKLLSRSGLTEIAHSLEPHSPSPSLKNFLDNKDTYISTIDSVIRFLRGADPTLCHRIAGRNFLPEGPRFEALEHLGTSAEEGLQWAFGALGIQDKAQHLASLYIDDLCDVIRDGIDPKFELSRYAEKLALSSASFDPLLKVLSGPETLVDTYFDEIIQTYLNETQPDVIGISIPFPGNVYGAFRIGKLAKTMLPNTKIIFGGGFVNTELRSLKDPRVFDYVDYITLDDGERPFLNILESKEYLRTFVRENGKVVFKTSASHDIPLKDSGTPSYEGLPLNQYLSLCELLNPMHRLWSDGRWNKLTLAHGCYWKKCSFCDTSLDYIGRYEPQAASLIVDRMQQLIQETGQTGFHFVDEAAPPNLLKALAQELIKRDLQVSWWGNIRFEKSFDRELTQLLAQSGCIAVSGGLEVASDRLLALMEKGVTVEQVARVTHAFTQSGIMVHAYLMYGFPSQTLEETVDSLERVRQLFEMGCIQSAFWHRFTATIHSPVGKNPEAYGIQLKDRASDFASNDVEFIDPANKNNEPARLHPGLKKAVYNYMHGLGIEDDVRNWFEFKAPKTKVPRNLISKAVNPSSGPISISRPSVSTLST